MMRLTRFIFTVFLVFSISTAGWAQSDEDSDDVVNMKVLPNEPPPQSDLATALKAMQEEEPAEPEKQKTGTEMANDYFMSCVAEDKPNYTIEIQESMCACAAANMTEKLSLQEMQVLQEASTEGENARTKFLIEAYSPCIQDTVNEVTINSCKNEEYLKRIIKGKKKICDCIVAGMKEYFDYNIPNITYQAVKDDPMTLDPLHYYLGTQEFQGKNYYFMRNCYNAHAPK